MTAAVVGLLLGVVLGWVAHRVQRWRRLKRAAAALLPVPGPQPCQNCQRTIVESEVVVWDLYEDGGGPRRHHGDPADCLRLRADDVVQNGSWWRS